jgi:hypothetical protein
MYFRATKGKFTTQLGDAFRAGIRILRRVVAVRRFTQGLCNQGPLPGRQRSFEKKTHFTP